MTILLDTHAFLWFIDGSSQLSTYARQLVEEPSNIRLVSVASLWEMAIKRSIGKLELTMSFPDMIEYQIYGNGMDLISPNASHFDRLVELPFHHRDPFDRLLVVHSLVEDIPILSRDPAFDMYEVQRLGNNG